MFKHYFSNNIGHMSFNFSVIVLINSVLDFFQIIELGDNMSRFILSLAFLIIVISLIPHTLSFLNFRSDKAYHVVNSVSQFSVLFLIASITGLIPISLESFISNAILFSLLYYISIKMRRQQLNKLANAINQQLSEQNN